MELTPTQQKTYNYILSFEKKHGYVPNNVVLSRLLKVSHVTVQGTIKTLIKKGYLKKKKPVFAGFYEVVSFPQV